MNKVIKKFNMTKSDYEMDTGSRAQAIEIANTRKGELLPTMKFKTVDPGSQVTCSFNPTSFYFYQDME